MNDSPLRATPQLTGKLVRRLGRGRLVAIRTAKTSTDGIVFFPGECDQQDEWLDTARTVSLLHMREMTCDCRS